MILGELIDFLERQDQERIVTRGFGRPHSYRMDYSECAFEPAVNVTVADMLAHAKGAIGPTFLGWKGGEYQFHERTEAFIAEYGDPGQPVDIMIIRLLEDDVALLKDELKKVRR